MCAFSPVECIRSLCAIGERQFEGERAAAQFIKQELQVRDIAYIEEPFETRIPRVLLAQLTADGVSIPCIATSFVSGVIESNYALISSLTSSQRFLYDANINFNPRCRGSISRSNHYFAPSVAIAREDVGRVVCAERVQGEVRIEAVSHMSGHILVGNTTNPTAVVFCHFDSIGPGATDNASGVATLLATIVQRPDLLAHVLFVFDGNEEVSFDEPIYWGAGYRTFESRHQDLLEAANQILIVDCVGNSPTEEIQDPRIVSLAFPIDGRQRFSSKITLLAGSYDELMRVYQSDIDVPDVIQERYVREAIVCLERRLGS